MLVALIPVSLDAPSGPTMFSTWDVEGKVDNTHIRDVYKSLESVME